MMKKEQRNKTTINHLIGMGRKTQRMARFGRRFACLALVLGGGGAFPLVSWAGDIVKIGVLAKRGPERCLERWAATADYLDEQIPEHSFEIIPLGFTEIFGAVEKGQVDFLLANSSIYVELSTRFRVARIATLYNLDDRDFPHAVFGGTVFFRKDQNPSPVWADLKKSRMAAVSPTSFGGWLTALREMKAVGLNSAKIAKGTAFAGTHDAVVYAVRDGKADAGVVRSDTLERMDKEGKINLADFSTIPCPGDTYRYHDQFTLLHSTRLYPEWPMAKAHHTSSELAQHVAIHLMGMPSDCEATRASHSSGWLTPLDYHPVEECLKELRARPFGDYGKISLGAAIRLHWRWLAIIIAFMGGVGGMGIRFVRVQWTNRRLVASQLDLEKTSEKLEAIVEERTAALETRNRELRESEERFKAIFTTTTDAMLIRDLETGAILDVNRRTCELYGLSREELMHSSVGDISADVPPYTQKEAKVWLRKAATGEPQHFEWHAKDKKGRLFWGEVNMRRAVIGPVERIVVSIRDITGRKQAEAEKERLMAAIDQSAETIVITDAEGTIQYVNPAFERITGYTREEAIGQNPRILKGDGQDDAFYQAMWDTLTAGEIWNGRFSNRKKDGTPYTEDARISPVKDPEGRIVNYVAIKSDITAELAREEQVRQMQKMESIGRLAGGVAHEFNNILQNITGLCGIILAEMEPQSAQRQDVAEIQQSVQHAGDLTQQLLAFSRDQPAEYKELDLNELLSSAEKMIQQVLDESFLLKFKLAPRLGPVHADASRFLQMAMNLVANARDAMPDGGEITLATRNLEIQEKDLVDWPNSKVGKWICFSVSDTGCGMDEKQLVHLFDPFYTTKELGEGSGLGLFAVSGIVEGHGGWISVSSEPGAGSVFRVCLPVSDGGSIDGDDSSGKRILLVDDDPAVLELTAKILQGAGYAVLVAEDIRKAEETFAENNGAFDLLFVDVMLPDGNGIELAEALLQQKAGLPVLLFSGRANDPAIGYFCKENGFGFIQKPFGLKKLLDAVDRAITGFQGSEK